jgi:hypothetical protein
VQIGIALNEHTHATGELVFRQACAMGLEGIVSKRQLKVKQNAFGVAFGVAGRYSEPTPRASIPQPPAPLKKA